MFSTVHEKSTVARVVLINLWPPGRTRYFLSKTNVNIASMSSLKMIHHLFRLLTHASRSSARSTTGFGIIMSTCRKPANNSRHMTPSRILILAYGPSLLLCSTSSGESSARSPRDTPDVLRTPKLNAYVTKSVWKLGEQAKASITVGRTYLSRLAILMDK
ncbi:hypothetical protein K439DRAFT_1637865 [Ramaria rubella]|nr:hypothetical protein K439DRAFT_1637865 [Ramaria rubella]